MLEEYDWTAFSVVSTRHHGYQDFLSIVEGLTDGSFIGWEKKSVVMLNLTDDPGGARARRLLKENEAQVEREGRCVSVSLIHSFNHSFTRASLPVLNHLFDFFFRLLSPPSFSDLSLSFLRSPRILIPFPISTYICVMRACVCVCVSQVVLCLPLAPGCYCSVYVCVRGCYCALWVPVH